MTTTTEPLTPAAVATLPDAELNELAAQIVMGWHRQDYAWADSNGKRTEYCNPDYTHQWSSDSHHRIFCPASNDAHAFVLVDALLIKLRFELAFLRDIQKWYAEFDGVREEWTTIGYKCHESRARAITEAAVLAAMAIKEGE